MKENAMIVNRETAMRLWNKSFGRAIKAKDFSGREMVKAAYDDRGSNFGWNIDHILPQSRGGKTTESNLICCHIITNDEKANKFPCFTTNDKRFEIIKVENHYEIKKIGDNQNNINDENEDDDINFYDSAAGIRFFKSLKGIQNKSLFVGTVNITLRGIQNTAVIDFINEIFFEKNIFYIKREYSDEVVIIVKDNNLPQKDDIADLLDSCVLLNTYLGYYFIPTNVIRSYNIFYGVHTNKDKIECLSLVNKYKDNSYNTLTINELVKINTKAGEKLNGEDLIGRDTLGYDVYKYDYIKPNLTENLKKANK